MIFWPFKKAISNTFEEELFTNFGNAIRSCKIETVHSDISRGVLPAQ